jgi:hypothetical protein
MLTEQSFMQFLQGRVDTLASPFSDFAAPIQVALMQVVLD